MTLSNKTETVGIYLYFKWFSLSFFIVLMSSWVAFISIFTCLLFSGVLDWACINRHLRRELMFSSSCKFPTKIPPSYPPDPLGHSSAATTQHSCCVASIKTQGRVEKFPPNSRGMWMDTNTLPAAAVTPEWIDLVSWRHVWAGLSAFPVTNAFINEGCG